MKACHSSRRAISAFIHRAATAKKSMKSRTKTKNQSRKLKNEGKITDYFNQLFYISHESLQKVQSYFFGTSGRVNSGGKKCSLQLHLGPRVP